MPKIFIRMRMRGIGAVMLCLILVPVLYVSPPACAQQPGETLQACATVPDLGYLLREIGGDQVSVTVFAKGPEDPHFLEAKPGFIKALNQADLFIEMGMELEAGWVPVLLMNARNGKILRGAKGYVDASAAITPMLVPTGQVDRSMGDVHPSGNPHYLLDPLNSLKVARLVRDKLMELMPQRAALFNDRYESFQRQVGVMLVGEKLAQKYDFEKLSLLFQHGRLSGFLKEQKEDALLGGWLGSMLPHYGAKAVGDHNMWPYFSNRFGLSAIGFLEPKPGISPTTKHIGEIVQAIRNEGVRIILTSPYFDLRPARLVSDQTGARIVRMAHQTGALEGTEDYLKMIDYNVRQVAGALAATTK